MAEAVLGVVRDAPKLRPPTLSFISATEILEEAGEEWYAGIWYTPEGEAVAEVHRICADDAKTATSGIHAIHHRPYLIEANHSTSSFGWQVADYQARATRKLIAAESKLIEAELWTAAVETSNRPIAWSGATVIAGTPSPVDAIAAIEQALAANTSGQRYMIHMRPKVFNSLMKTQPNLLHKDPSGGSINRWLTPMDNIVVPGRGYKGTGPAGQVVGATEWVYATPMIYLRRGEIVTNPQDLKQATRRDNNTITFYAERVVGTDWDLSVSHLALEVTP